MSEYTYSFEECLAFVDTQSPATSDAHKKILAEGLRKYCVQAQEHLPRAWLQFKEGV